ncbi:hypothetical protein KY328_00465, partial [Candidatus Woesearchaeota archaeon]|nr:hypothetical protein [Candidatus Woesearchaeota archaeon]
SIVKKSKVTLAILAGLSLFSCTEDPDTTKAVYEIAKAKHKKTKIEKVLKGEPLEEYVLSPEHNNPEFRKAFAIASADVLNVYYKNRRTLKVDRKFKIAVQHTVVNLKKLWDEVYYNSIEWVSTFADSAVTSEGVKEGLIGKIKEKIEEHAKKVKLEHPEISTHGAAKEFLKAGILAEQELLELFEKHPIPKTPSYEYMDKHPELVEAIPVMLDKVFDFGDYAVAAREAMNAITEKNYSSHTLEVADFKATFDQKYHSVTIADYKVDAKNCSITYIDPSLEPEYDRIKLEALSGIENYGPYQALVASIMSKKAINQINIKRLEDFARTVLVMHEQSCIEARSFERLEQWHRLKPRRPSLRRPGATEVVEFSAHCPLLGKIYEDEYGIFRCSKHSPEEQISSTTVARQLGKIPEYQLNSQQRAVKIYIQGCQKLNYHMTRYPLAKDARKSIERFDAKNKRIEFRNEYARYSQELNNHQLARSDAENIGVLGQSNFHVFKTEWIDGQYRITNIQQRQKQPLPKPKYSYTRPEETVAAFVNGFRNNNMAYLRDACLGEMTTLIENSFGYSHLREFFADSRLKFVGRRSNHSTLFFGFTSYELNPRNFKRTPAKMSLVVRKISDKYKVIRINSM